MYLPDTEVGFILEEYKNIHKSVHLQQKNCESKIKGISIFVVPKSYT